MNGNPNSPASASTNLSPGDVTGQNNVKGRIFFDYGLPAASVSVRVYSRDFGGKDTKLAEGKTDEKGYYLLSYNSGSGVVNLELRAVDAQGKEIPLSYTKYDVAAQELINLVAPGSLQPLAPEFQRLAADMDIHIGGMGMLGQAQENASRQDLSILYHTAGWDARLLALGSMAAILNQTTGIGQDTLYALFRAGLPTDPKKLCLVSPTTIQKALGKANEAGIVSLNDQQILAATDAFKNFARKTRLTLVATGANSTFGDFLNKSGLTGEQQNAFADLYFSQSSSADGFWQKAAGLGIPAQTLDTLKLQGKLAYLTLNNADLTQKLQREIGSFDNLARLPEKDFHTNAAWKSYLTEMAGSADGQAMDKLIPPAYQGKTTSDRLEAYAADLARKVRLSFSTQVVRRMVEKGDLIVGANTGSTVTTFLNNVEPLGYQLGRTPLNSFLKQNGTAAFQGIASGDQPATIQNVKTLHRLYQITPTNESLQTVAKLGFTSAYDVAAFNSHDFIDRFGKAFPSINEAQLVYEKAQQVSSVALNFVATAKQLDAPPLYALSPASSVREGAKQALLKQFPTMESLFGSLDFCSCEDCRSVLSPAAYLVDLLKFLDPDDKQWNSFLTVWQSQHNRKNYTDKFLKPYDALVLRRPDLPHLPLTCENTNTVLPYIDIVNEILEYYIANNGQLDAGAAYDTGTALSPDLMAEPQNILPMAYTILNGTLYPLGLPFDLWIQTVRRLLEYFKTPLWRLLEVFRPADPLELFSDPNKYAYYRAGILTEYLGISPAEYAIFTNTDPLGNWFGLYGYNDNNQGSALNALQSAKTLSFRLNVSYQELADLVSTGFINPQLNALVTLRKLDIEPEDVFRYEGQAGYSPLTAPEKAAFETRLEQLTNKYNPHKDPRLFDAGNWLRTTWANGGFNQILVLSYPDSGCNFDATRLQYANGTAPTPSLFLKLNFFVRMWKRLGWTLEETDRALQVFVTPNFPSDADPQFGQKCSGAMKTGLVYLSNLQALSEKLQPGPYGRVGLLSLWSNIPTIGVNPLYSRLFLNPSVLQNDAAFDDPMGNYLSRSLLINDHLLVLQCALNLTSDEVDLILADAGLDPATAPLSVANVSLLYRYGLLARGLQLSISDFVALKAMSGLNPFAALSSQPLGVLADDLPLTQTLAFVDAAQKALASGFTVGDLQYLLRHEFDPEGKYRPDPDALMQLVRSLSNSIHLVQSQNAVLADPLAFTDDVIKQKLALVFPSDVVQTFLGMWTGTVQYTAVQGGVVPGSQLDPAAFAKEPEIQLSYDSSTQTQKLTFEGVLLDTQKTKLTSAHPSPLLAGLLNAVQAQARAFFEKYLQAPISGQEAIGFLPKDDFDLLFAPVVSGATDAEKQTQIQHKRGELAKNLLPYLQQKLISQAIVQAMASDLNADASLTKTLTTKANLLSEQPTAKTPLLNAFIAVAQSGISAVYSDSTGATLLSGTAATTDTTVVTVDASGSIKSKPAGTSSAHFEGYLEVLSDGAFGFFAQLGKKNAQVELEFDFLPNSLFRGVAADDGAEFSGFVELKAGIPYHFTLLFSNLGGGDARLLVQGGSLSKGPLSQLTLYPGTTVERFTRVRTLLSKTLQLIEGFDLNEREVTYLITNATDFNNLSFSALPTQSSDDSALNAATLFGQFLRLAGYASLRPGPAGGTDGLLEVFENARGTFPATDDPNRIAQVSQAVLDRLYRTVAKLTRRTWKIVQATAQQLGYKAKTQVSIGQLLVQVSDLTHEKGFQRLWDALQVVQTVGIPVNSLAGATGIIDGTKGQDVRFAIAGNLKNALKAHYTQDAWRPIAQSVFDKLRQEKRDALSTYLVNQLGVQNAEQLFEYFLVDPGMEPVVKTSRVRLALSSVQTFIQRCLLNLEEKVDPSVILSDQWEWMKRYRVWQANREIFLWPENWMEPEWRLDKTDLFQRLESTLFQGDVTDALVEDAFFAYLKDLEERARLDIVTMYLDEKTPDDPASNTLHVIGRHYGKPQKYYYRRYAFGTWTAWEPVKVDIEGDQLAAIVWRERLHLFWVTFLTMGKPQDPGSSSYQDLGNQPVQANLPQHQVRLQLHWSDYFQGKWSDPKSSDLNRLLPIDVPDDYNSLWTYIHVAKEYDDSGNEGAVKIILDYPLWQAFRLVGKNSEPDLSADNWEAAQSYDTFFGFTRAGGDVPAPTSGLPTPTSFVTPWVDATKITGSGPIQVEVPQVQGGQVTETPPTPEPILQQGNRFSLLFCDTPVMPISQEGVEAKTLRMPFFYQDTDDNVTLFVEPSLTETTITEWKGWAPGVTPPSNIDKELGNRSVTSQVPAKFRIDPGDPAVGDPAARFPMQPNTDPFAKAATTVVFGTSVIGRSGGIAVQQAFNKIARGGLKPARL